MSEACLFCDIVADASPAHIVHATDDSVAFLDLRPLFFGHTLVVPRRHYRDLDALPPEEVGPFFETVQLVSEAVRDAMEAKGTFVAMNNEVSQSVPHLHVHVVPRTKGDGLRGFFWPRTKYADEAAMSEVAARIRARLEVSDG